jgi:hypothetical protein
MSARDRMHQLMLTSALSFGLTGCSDGVEIPKVVKVTGTVTYKDKPLADAEVGFLSKLDNKDVKPASGKTNTEGEFSLTTYIDPQHEVSGATPGDYKVVVTKNEEIDLEAARKQFTSGKPNLTFKKLVPVKYTAKESSPLEATVSLDGDNKFEFKLAD